MRLSPPLLISLVVSAVLGVAGGAAFRWAEGPRAWELLTAAFLWSLIVIAGTTIGRFAGERVRRGNWRRGLALAGAQSFPLAGAFLLAAALAGAPLSLSTVGLALGATLLVALCTGVLGVLTSPFTR